MEQLRIDSAINLLDDWIELKDKYANPIFVCNRSTIIKIRTFHDKDHEYFWKPDFDNPMRDKLFEQPLIQDENINGLFIMENNYKCNTQ